MYLRFKCPGKNSPCGNDTWTIDYETESKSHRLTCLKCGYNEFIEEIFKGGGKKKNVISKTNKSPESSGVRTSEPKAQQTTTQPSVKPVWGKTSEQSSTSNPDKKTMV